MNTARNDSETLDTSKQDPAPKPVSPRSGWYWAIIIGAIVIFTALVANAWFIGFDDWPFSGGDPMRDNETIEQQK